MDSGGSHAPWLPRIHARSPILSPADCRARSVDVPVGAGWVGTRKTDIRRWFCLIRRQGGQVGWRNSRNGSLPELRYRLMSVMRQTWDFAPKGRAVGRVRFGWCSRARPRESIAPLSAGAMVTQVTALTRRVLAGPAAFGAAGRSARRNTSETCRRCFPARIPSSANFPDESLAVSLWLRGSGRSNAGEAESSFRQGWWPGQLRQ